VPDLGVELDPGVRVGFGVATEVGLGLGVGIEAVVTKQLPYWPTKVEI
jgi:hypothetical protein